jgi:CRISPR-associated protein Csm3
LPIIRGKTREGKKVKLKKIVKFEGKIVCLTGLCIGGTNNDINIGGLDKEVIKNPVTNEPYIPGSSLKGKMRSQLEKIKGIQGKTPCGCGRYECDVCLIFGSHSKPGAASDPTRIIVRDAKLSDESKMLYHNLPAEKVRYTESKVENLIDRPAGMAHPRTNERVPEGAKFDMEILLQIYDRDDEDRLKNAVRKALELVELSYLGGSGTRGYGKVRFDYEEGEIDI